MNSDFSDLLRAFNDNGVRYLIVGGHAVMLYTEPRYTKDLDVWVEASGDNAERVYRSLAAFGAPRGAAVLGVLSYRLIEFWLPIPVGALAWLSFEVDRIPDRRERITRLRAAAADAADEAPVLRDWALQHGIAVPTNHRRR